MVRYIKDDEAALTWHDTPPKGYLALLVNGRVSQIVALQEPVELGRDKSNALVVSDPKVSRNHAVIAPHDDLTVEIKDYGSSNGTYVNNLLIKQPLNLQDNDHIRVGDTVFLFTLNKPTPNMLVDEVAAPRDLAVPILAPPFQPTPNLSFMQNPTTIWLALGCVMILVVVLMIVLAFLLGTLMVSGG